MSVAKAKIATRRAFGERVLERGADDKEFVVFESDLGKSSQSNLFGDAYPPHTHEVHNLPAECDLDEIYYFRIDHPDGYALFRTYNRENSHDVAVTVHDGDAV